MRRLPLRLIAGALAVPLALSLPTSGCSSSTTPPVIRSFQRPQNIDVLCMQVLIASTGALITPIPVTQDHCAPVPENVTGSTLPYHLFALVTQETLGAVAVVDLTGGWVVDEDRSTPGLNFIPVGELPAGVVAAPDGQMAYVASAAANKSAIYTIPAARMLGDWQGLLPIDDAGATAYQLPLTLPDLPVCQLPQPPMSISIVTKTAAVVAPGSGNGGDGGGADGGGPDDASTDGGIETDGGADAGATQGPAVGYELVVVMRGTDTNPPIVAVVDPSSLAASGGQSVAGVAAAPTGTVAPCTIVGHPVPLSSSLPTVGWAPGPAWSQGIPYIDGGISLADAEPPLGPGPAYTPVVNNGLPDGGFGYTQGATPSAVVVRNDEANLLYVADSTLPMIHIFDVSSSSGPPVELQPLLATSQVTPSRLVQVGPLAISPATSSYQRFLYAVDQVEGSLMVFDVTDPVNSPHVPLTRPNPELNPFEEPDRITFSSPVAAVSFVRHDWPLAVDLQGNASSVVQTGVICNPNPVAHPTSATYTDFGAFYQNDVSTVQVLLGPSRLRGIFGFAALSNGSLVTIDVDDWDAPCRRPDPLDAKDQVSLLAAPEPVASTVPTDPTYDDPYHAPLTYQTGSDDSLVNDSPVSLESFYPVSVPHRPRSASLLRDDPSNGNHTPTIINTPELWSQTSTTLATQGANGLLNPMMLPTIPVGTSVLADPAYVIAPTTPDPGLRGFSGVLPLPPVADAGNNDGAVIPWAQFSLPYLSASPSVRFAYEDPVVQSPQNWTITYEGKLPTVNGIVGTFVTSDQYQTLTLSAPGANLCELGIEDDTIAAARIAEVQAEAARRGLSLPSTMANWVGDYIEIQDALIDNTDLYWGLTDDAGVGCWDWLPAENQNANDRYNACNNAFGDITNADTTYTRDFPILASTNDTLTLGRFAWSGVETPESRTIVGPDPTNAPTLQQLQCCFHHEAQFWVRTGGEWVAVASSTPFLHHVTSDGGVCTLSTDPNDALKNSRSFGINRVWQPDAGPAACSEIDPGDDDGQATLENAASIAPDRNSPLAMRNPMFSYLMWNGCPSEALDAGVYTTNQRDETWKFTTGGSYSPQTISLGGSGGTAVSPQSMLFIDSLGQLAVIDGLSQGLILIDLNLLQLAHTPYY